LHIVAYAKGAAMNMRTAVKRISIMIGEEQYEMISKKGLNISAFIRGLIDDHFSQHLIALSVSKKTYDLYNNVISNSGATDKDIEPLLVEVLKKVLDERLDKIKTLRSEIE
jgi:hypothetical protein